MGKKNVTLWKKSENKTSLLCFPECIIKFLKYIVGYWMSDVIRF